MKKVVEQLLKDAKSKFDETVSWYKKELAGLRAGRATPALVEDILVEAYGTKMPLKQVAAISLPDAKSIAIEPWDQAVIPAIERAISQAEGLGLAPSTKGKTIFVNIPPLSEERRKALVKIMRERLEEARIRARKHREETWNEVQRQEKDGKIREDEKFRAKDKLQGLVDETNKALEDIAEQKEKEIMDTAA